MVSLLPLFPLPNVVLFPGALLPLHIFEPRYRDMVADALDADRRLVMVLLRPGWEADYEGRPAIYPVSCSGVIIHDEKLDDGRYNIVLRGLDRIRVVSEDHGRAYRRAAIELWPDAALDHGDRIAVRDLRGRLDTMLGLSAPSSSAAPHRAMLASMPDEDLVHALAQSLDLEPVEKQALLERDNLRLRAEMLVELLEMRKLLANLPRGGNQPH
ncbi:MAG TPA: LON peptidase substrate-binding domain-containing protein [Vicinamibacterales bacterium]|nr:LON peptidase substrate-binding domain-containing protein [Vicinamibacterales bacterium]